MSMLCSECVLGAWLNHVSSLLTSKVRFHVNVRIYFVTARDLKHGTCCSRKRSWHSYQFLPISLFCFSNRREGKCKGELNLGREDWP